MWQTSATSARHPRHMMSGHKSKRQDMDLNYVRTQVTFEKMESIDVRTRVKIEKMDLFVRTPDTSKN